MRAGGASGARRSRRRRYDVVIVGGGGHGLATAYYLAKEHGITNVAVLEKGWLGGGNTGRNTTIIRSNYLYDESAAIYEHARQALGRPCRQELNYNVMFSQRGVLMLAHNTHDVQSFKRHIYANRLNGVDNEWLTPEEAQGVLPAAQRLARPALSGAGRAPCSGAAARRAMTRWRGAMRAAPTRSASTSSRTARSLGSAATPDGARRGRGDRAGLHRHAARRRRRRGPHQRRHGDAPACACRSRAFRCRRWSRSP